jgi:hypothetical protein
LRSGLPERYLENHFQKGIVAMIRRIAVVALVAFMAGGCSETLESAAVTPTGDEYGTNKFADGSVEVYWNFRNCVVRYGKAGELISATEGKDGCTEEFITRSKEIAVRNGVAG